MGGGGGGEASVFYENETVTSPKFSATAFLLSVYVSKIVKLLDV